MGIQAADHTTSRVLRAVSAAGAGDPQPRRSGGAPAASRTVGGGAFPGAPFSRDTGTPGDPIAALRGIRVIPRDEPPPSTPYAPPGEQALHALLRAGDYTAQDLDALAEAYPDYRMPATLLAAAVRFAAGDFGEITRRQLRRLFHHSADPATHPFFTTHLSAASCVRIGVAPGVSIDVPFSHDTVGLMLAESHRSEGHIDPAIEAAEQVTPGPRATLILAALYAEADRNSDILRITGAAGNDDDISALLLTYRGIAFARTGLFESARKAYNRALARRNLARAIRTIALRQRAELRAANGRYAHARRDLQRILAEDPAAEDVSRRLAELRGN